MIIRAIVSVSVAILVAAPAGAQVLEIGSDGAVTTYDRPTLFQNDHAKPIVEPKSESVSSEGTANLLAEAAAQTGLNRDLLFSLARQESRFRPDAVSNKGAIGMLQLMPATAAELGVDPNDVRDNIRGGAIYLRRQLDRFGSVPLALAAYNAGPGAVIRYHGIPPFAETQTYVSRIMRSWHPAVTKSVSSEVHPAVIEVP